MRRFVAVAAGVALFSLALTGVGEAATRGVCSKTSLRPGAYLKVHGTEAIPGESAFLNFNGKVIGGETVDGWTNFIVRGKIPGSTLPGVYQISVTFDGGTGTIEPCTVRVKRRR